MNARELLMFVSFLPFSGAHRTPPRNPIPRPLSESGRAAPNADRIGIRQQRGHCCRFETPIRPTETKTSLKPPLRYPNLGAQRRTRIEVPGWIEGPVTTRSGHSQTSASRLPACQSGRFILRSHAR
jgi:hypothetical protein